MALRSSSICSFTSDQLDVEEIEEDEELEYHSAPWDIFGVHDTDGSILAVKKGESLPATTKYKRKHSSSIPVKFHVNTKLQVETIAYEPKPKKKKSREIIPDKCDGVLRLTGEQSPQLSLPCDEGNSGGGRSGMSSLPCDEGEKSPQSPCDEGHRGAGRSGMSGILY